jgi:hypothetical protein
MDFYVRLGFCDAHETTWAMNRIGRISALSSSSFT